MTNTTQNRNCNLVDRIDQQTRNQSHQLNCEIN